MQSVSPHQSTHDNPCGHSAVGVTRLMLSDFRNYTVLEWLLAPMPVVLTGPNGAGKTNLLEALSLFSSGKGLRGAKLSSISTQNASAASSLRWAVASDIMTAHGVVHMGTGLDFLATGAERRVIVINESVQKSQAAFSAWLNVVWLTPQMGGLFIESSAGRRKFIDRMSCALDKHHADYIHRYEHYLRQRSILLKEGRADAQWLDVLEQKISQNAIILTSIRRQMIELLNRHQPDIFPHFHASMSGEFEDIFSANSALETEEQLRQALKKNRATDALTGGAQIGPHRSDFCVKHLGKGLSAELCSTGEQKILLLSLILSYAQMTSQRPDKVTLLLLDDVVAHLDHDHRCALFDTLNDFTHLQTWMTGTDPSDFHAFRTQAQFFSVLNATLRNG